MRTLIWGIKSSLLGYVRGMSDGEVLLTGAVVETGHGFAFPADDSGPADGTLRFRGEVVLRGHGGLMHITIAEPWLQPDGDGWQLTILDDESPQRRMPFARAAVMRALPDGKRRGEQVCLTREGADLFFGPYEAGTPVDDLLVTP